MVTFVLATIQQGLETVPAITESMIAQGIASRFAFGSKRAGLAYLEKNGADLYRDAMAARDDADALLDVFLRAPGLGLVKAGFACQLFANKVGCLDVHNVRMYGLDARTLRWTAPKRPETRAKKRRDYIELCERLGGSVRLWRSWCEYKATVRPSNWLDGAAEVSRLHVEVLAGTYDHAQTDFMFDVDERPRFELAA
jgi:hypothetical protein